MKEYDKFTTISNSVDTLGVCTTVRPYRGHANATALFRSPVVGALGSELDDLGSSPGRGKVLRRTGKKNASSAFRLG